MGSLRAQGPTAPAEEGLHWSMSSNSQRRTGLLGRKHAQHVRDSAESPPPLISTDPFTSLKEESLAPLDPFGGRGNGKREPKPKACFRTQIWGPHRKTHNRRARPPVLSPRKEAERDLGPTPSELLQWLLSLAQRRGADSSHTPFRRYDLLRKTHSSRTLKAAATLWLKSMFYKTSPII